MDARYVVYEKARYVLLCDENPGQRSATLIMFSAARHDDGFFSPQTLGGAIWPVSAPCAVVDPRPPIARTQLCPAVRLCLGFGWATHEARAQCRNG
jgi:hypothetical protein